MKPTAIYVRTDKGSEEVARRSQAIPAKARSLLLMIDGKLNGAQLLEKFSGFDNSAELLQLLEDGGYIVGEAAGGTAAAVSGTSAGGAPGASPATDALRDAKRLTIQVLHEIMGPDADTFTPRVEAALTSAELRAHAQKFRDIFIDIGRPKKAAVFWQAFEQLLPPE